MDKHAIEVAAAYYKHGCDLFAKLGAVPPSFITMPLSTLNELAAAVGTRPFRTDCTVAVEYRGVKFVAFGD